MTKLYYKLPPEQIFDDIARSHELKNIEIKGQKFLVYPHVYPSDKFRTTNFLLDNIQPLLHHATVCDMGCGMGIVGLYALEQGAKRVVQVDINPAAVENAKANIALCKSDNKRIKVFESDCFENVPLQTFDIIIFNIPFHSESYEIEDPLEFAFHDPNFTSTKKFLSQALNYSHSGTQILIAFSNKGNVPELEKIFDLTGLKWELWRITNKNQKYDNRIYRLQVIKK